MKTGLIVFLFCATLLSPGVYAIRVSGLYQTVLPVDNESSTARAPALKQALNQVLIKLTGDRNTAAYPGINEITKYPGNYVQQFRYRQTPNPGKPGDKTLELWVQFDEAMLNNAMRTYGIPIWGKERPSVLVWLAGEKNTGRSLVSFDENPEYLSMLDKYASARGISLLFPLLDLKDTADLSVSDIWGGFKQPVLSASRRYRADVVLTGKISRVSAPLWESRWIAYFDDRSIEWNSRGESVDIALAAGVNELVDRLATVYVKNQATHSETIELFVADVNTTDDYARALAYLQAMQSVSAVRVRRVFADKVLFEITGYGGLTGIDQAIKLGKTLERKNETGTDTLTYRLLTR